MTVYNTDDDGPGSLRQAVVDAVDGDTITFHSDLYGKTITLTNSGATIKEGLPTLAAVSTTTTAAA